jgi:hypothetical protein
MATAIPLITVIGAGPSTSDPDNFDERGDKLLHDDLPTMTSELNVIIPRINTAVSEINTDRSNIENYADIVQSAANFKGKWSDLTGSISLPATVHHSGTFWVLAEDLADITAHEPATGSSVWLELTLHNSLYGGVLQAMSDVGLLGKEIDAQRFTRHQQGSVTLYNRGVKSDCDITKSAVVTRNIDLSAGVVFGYGRSWGVAAQSAYIPENDGATSDTCQVYIDDDMSLQVTALGADAPVTGITLATITVPAGSDESTDQYLASCTVTETARQEPDWPGIQLSQPYEDIDFGRKMTDTDYNLNFDISSYQGGEKPYLKADAASRSVNTYRLYLAGMADTVVVRYAAHLMNF